MFKIEISYTLLNYYIMNNLEQQLKKKIQEKEQLEKEIVGLKSMINSSKPKPKPKKFKKERVDPIAWLGLHWGDVVTHNYLPTQR